MPKGIAYSPDEDCIIVRAAIRAGSDPVIGSDMKGYQYNQKLYDVYKSLAVGENMDSKIIEDRTKEGIRQRFSKLKELCRKFNGFYITVESTSFTGIGILSDDEKINLASLLYDGKCSNVRDTAYKRVKNSYQDRVKVFEHVKCWSIFQSTPGFTSEQIGQSQTDGAVFDLQRPIGRKRAKQQMNRNDESENVSPEASAANRLVDFLEAKRSKTDRSEEKRHQQMLALQVANAPNTDPEVSRRILSKLGEDVLKWFECDNRKQSDSNDGNSIPSSPKSFASIEFADMHTREE